MVPSFSQTPPKILFHHANIAGGGHYRILLPARALRAQRYAVTQSSMQLLDPAHLDAMQPDSVVFQHLHTPPQVARMRQYRQELKGRHFVYEIDDAFWHVPDGSVHKGNIPSNIREQIVEAARLCDSITVTTPSLAKVMRQATGMKDIRVVPNQIPKTFAHIASHAERKPRSDKALRIGWAGGIGHSGDLKLIADVMAELRDVGLTWVFMGMSPPGIDRARIEYHEAVDFEQYAEAVGALDLDIALAPLEDIEFNRCKSDLRVLEYGACGYSVLASDILTYAHCPVVKVANTVEAWVKAIVDFANDDARRSNAADVLYDWVRLNRTLEQHVVEYSAAYIPMRSAGFTPDRVPPTGKLATVGAPVQGLPFFESIQAAWTAEPGADILYLRSGVALHDFQLHFLTEALSTSASVCPLTNDGDFPQARNFSPVALRTALSLDEAAHLLNLDPVGQPYPTGPCVLLSAAALARFGLPDTKRLPHIEAALFDWGARVAEMGGRHTLLCNMYVPASAPSPVGQDMADLAAKHAVVWTPPFLEALTAHQQNDKLANVRRELELAYHSINYQHPLPDQSYADWAAIFDTVSPLDREAMANEAAKWIDPPRISVILPVFNPMENFLAVAIESVLSQTYQNWELCIADDASTSPLVRKLLESYAAQDPRIKVVYRETNGHICAASNSALAVATGEWVCFLDHDDALAEHALYTVAAAIRENRDALFFYSDADKLSESGQRIDPYFAPDFNYELLLAQNYVTHLSAYRLDLVNEIGGLRVTYEGSQDWDLTLRYLDRCGEPPFHRIVQHVPHVLYHWRQSVNSTAANIGAKPYALEAGRRAVADHLRRVGEQAALSAHPLLPVFNLVRYLVPEDAPRVSIIIPTRDNPEQLGHCIASIEQNTAYSNFEVIIVDNASRTNAALTQLAELAKHKRVRVLRDARPFNYSAMNNAARDSTTGEFLCLLNDDTEIVMAAWLNDLVGAAMRRGVGAVGPKLAYPNGYVQECGIVWSANAPPMMAALHAFQRLPLPHPGHFGRAHLPAEVIAVTGACLVIKRSTWDEVGGLDETFAQDFNDVDLCLRLYRRGYRNLVLPHIVVRHHEGATKKRFADQKVLAQVTRDEQRLRTIHANVVDPFVNPNLAHGPNYENIAVPPLAKPWAPILRERVLIINGGKPDAVLSYQEGDIAFCATVAGHFLRITYPELNNVPPLDLRRTPDELAETLGKLAISKVIFTGIGDGTLGLVGFLTALAQLQWRVEWRPGKAARGENPHDYIDPQGWKNTWSAFNAAIEGKDDAFA